MGPNRQVQIYGSKKMVSRKWVKLTDKKKNKKQKKRKCHENWYVIKTEILPKLKYHQNWYVTKTEMSPNLKCHQNWSFTKTEVSPKLNCHQNWTVIKTKLLLKLKCYHTLYLSSKIKIKIPEIGTEYLGLVTTYLPNESSFCNQSRLSENVPEVA